MGVRIGGDRCANLAMCDTVLIVTEKHKEITANPGCMLNNGKLATVRQHVIVMRGRFAT